MFNVVLIETHNLCNRRCWFCKFGQSPGGKRVFLSLDLIVKIANELNSLSYMGRISLFGINEPLLDERIVDIVAIFRQACPGAYIQITTNGDLLDGYLYDELKSVGLSSLSISLYDTDSEEKLRELGDRLSEIKLIEMRDPLYLENRAGSIPMKASVPDCGCDRPSNMLVIKATGKVVLCCADMYGAVEIGDIKDQELQEIWYSDKFEHYRNHLKSGRKGLLLCERCSHNGTTSSIF